MTLSSATVALPLINVLLTYLVLRALLPRFAPQHAGRRQCLLLATVIWGVSVAVLTEVASLFNRLDVRTIASVWLALDLGCVAVLLFARPRHSSRPAAGSDNQSQQNAEPLGWSWQIVLAGMAVLAIVTGGVALIAAPNDGDSMSYHLPRIMHWMQNRSLEPYPSASLHSLAIQPWAEYAMLQLHLCSGTDRFSNLVQWYAFIVQGVAVTLIAAELGAAPRTQVLAAALSLTIPAAILQASLTKNDIVASLWITLLAYYTLRLRVDFSWISLIGFGVSLGLAMLTKGPMYCFALPFVVWASITGLRRLRHAALLPLATAALIALSLNTGYFLRNYTLFGSPAGSRPFQSLMVNSSHGPDVCFSNGVRGLAMHVPIPRLGLYRQTELAVRRVHTWLGLDPDDPRTTGRGHEFHIPSWPFYWATQGNPFHAYLAMATCGLFLWPGCGRGDPRMIGYALAILAGFLLLCSLLKWYPVVHRYQLPMFALGSAWVARVLELRLPRLLLPLSLCFLLQAMPFVLFNQNRPLLPQEHSILRMPRSSQHFLLQRKLREPVTKLARLLAKHGVSRIGLAGSVDNEYGLWAALGAELRGPFRLEHVGRQSYLDFAGLAVHNPSAQLPYPAGPFHAEVAIAQNVPPDQTRIIVEGDELHRVWHCEPLTLFARTDLLDQFAGTARAVEEIGGG